MEEKHPPSESQPHLPDQKLTRKRPAAPTPHPKPPPATSLQELTRESASQHHALLHPYPPPDGQKPGEYV
jgi:hypothetical protein